MKERSEKYDLLKIIAEVLVVIGHVTAMYSATSAIPQAVSSTLLSSTYKAVGAGVMPLFMCLSGAVYNYCIGAGKYNNRLRFLGGKFLRLMLPYYFFSICTVAPVVVGLNIVYYDFPQFLLRGTLMAGYTRHLWYIISLFSIFILCAVFRNTLQKCPPVILLAVFSVISFYSARLNTSVFQVHQTTYYLLYFYVGMLVDRYWDGFFGIIRRGRHVFFAAGIAAVVYYTLYSEIKYIAAFGFILAGFSLAAMVNTEKASGNRLYEMLRRDSFGVYLFHPMMLYLLYYRLRGEVLNPYIWGVLSMTGVYIASVALSELFRCLGLGLLLGEKPEKVRSREESSEKLP